MILPTTANADGTLAATCEHCPAGSQLKASLAVTHIKFALKADGTSNPHILQVDCPNCGSVTLHPVQGDGRCRTTVRDLFARTIQRLGCPSGDCAAGNYANAQAHVTACNTLLGGPP